MKNNLLTKIKNLLPDQAWPWVITALRQDELIWDSLLTNDELIQNPPDDDQFPERWNPAWITFQILDWPLPKTNESLSLGLRQRAFQAYEVITQRRNPTNVDITPLTRSALLAPGRYHPNAGAGLASR